MNYTEIIEKLSINSCGTSDCEPDWTWDTGRPGFTDFDLWFALCGSGCIKEKNTSYEITKGTCMLFVPNTRYIGTHNPNDRLRVVNVHFNLYSPDTAAYPFPTYTQQKKITNMPLFIDLLNRVLIGFNSNNMKIAEHWLRCALIEFFEQNSLVNLSNYSPWNQVISEICNQIHLQCDAPPTLSDIADLYGYSTDYIGRMFKSVTKVSFSEYVIKARLLLSTSCLTVEQISEQLGYYDACHFIRQFKSHTGSTPYVFRKNSHALP